MKWGVRKDRDKSSFNTSYKQTMLDNHGRLLAVNGKTVNRGNRQHRKASRVAMREMNAYRKANKKANWKDSLSVAGNKYEETLSKIPKKKQQKIKQKENYKLVKDRLKQSGKRSMDLQKYETGGVSKKKVKKYLGQDISISQVNDYLKHRNKKATAMMTTFAGVSLAAVAAYSMR